jgi:ligand-binding SRPBCC domain-containing protein
MPEFETRLTLPCDAEVLFDFLIRPDNIRKISPEDVKLTFVKAPDILSCDAEMTFRIEGFGVTQEITHQVTEFESPRHFTEKQTRGPLKRWIHRHVLEPAASGGTTMIDQIEFERPGGMLRFIVTEAKILNYLEQGFEHRHSRLRTLFPSDD